MTLPNPASAAPLGPAARTGNTAFPTSVALLLLRLALGWTFIRHGYQLVFELGADNFARNLHLPLLPEIVWAYLAVWGQLLGGISIFLGLFARLGSLPLIVNMLVAIAIVHLPNGFMLVSDYAHPERIGYEYNLNLIAEALVILLAGPGLISLDALLFRRGLWAIGPQPLDQPVKRV
ncbi:MAG: DoxX family protein [Phycisphaerae bacterium]